MTFGIVEVEGYLNLSEWHQGWIKIKKSRKTGVKFTG